jgi:hypothetical protein
MVYILPQKYKCIKCDYEFQYSPHNPHPAPSVYCDPVCPVCWDKFIRENVGIGYCTESWNGESEYEMKKNELL